jgi:hypothetical protein
VPKPLAEIVIEEGLATAADVEHAADWADRERAPMVVALVREVGLDEVALVAAIRRHVRVGLGDPAHASPELDAVRELPREVARRLRVVPLSIGSAGGGRRSLELLVADPTDAVALAEVEHVTGCEVEPKLMPLSAVEELVETSYRHLVTEVMKREARPRRGGGSGGKSPARSRGARGITARHDVAAVPVGQAEPAQPSVDPDLVLRHRALLALLVKKELVTLDEYEAEVRRLAEGREKER